MHPQERGGHPEPARPTRTPSPVSFERYLRPTERQLSSYGSQTIPIGAILVRTLEEEWDIPHQSGQRIKVRRCASMVSKPASTAKPAERKAAKKLPPSHVRTQVQEEIVVGSWRSELPASPRRRSEERRVG